MVTETVTTESTFKLFALHFDTPKGLLSLDAFASGNKDAYAKATHYADEMGYTVRGVTEY